jgi:hypothetical protein
MVYTNLHLTCLVVNLYIGYVKTKAMVVITVGIELLAQLFYILRQLRPHKLIQHLVDPILYYCCFFRVFFLFYWFNFNSAFLVIFGGCCNFPSFEYFDIGNL